MRGAAEEQYTVIAHLLVAFSSSTSRVQSLAPSWQELGVCCRFIFFGRALRRALLAKAVLQRLMLASVSAVRNIARCGVASATCRASCRGHAVAVGTTSSLRTPRSCALPASSRKVTDSWRPLAACARLSVSASGGLTDEHGGVSVADGTSVKTPAPVYVYWDIGSVWPGAQTECFAIELGRLADAFGKPKSRIAIGRQHLSYVDVDEIEEDFEEEFDPDAFYWNFIRDDAPDWAWGGGYEDVGYTVELRCPMCGQKQKSEEPSARQALQGERLGKKSTTRRRHIPASQRTRLHQAQSCG